MQILMLQNVQMQMQKQQKKIVRAQNPLPTNNTLSFFQVQVLKCSVGHLNQCGLNIGLITKDGNPRAYSGKYMNSIGYVNSQIYLNKKKVTTVPQLAKKDRMGCGINCSNMTFFFTKNKQIVAKDIRFPQNSKWNEFYPAVALQNQEETIKVHFQKKEFVFDIQKLANEIQVQIREEIFNEESKQNEINSSQIYSLISQYMLFNGYSKTLELMRNKKKQIQFQPINKLTRSVQTNKISINLDEENNLKNEENQLMNIEVLIQQDVQIKQQIIPKQSRLKSRMRQRIMSDVHPQIVQEEFSQRMIEEGNEPRRKNTQIMGFYQEIPDYKLRKQSNLSNISLMDDQSIHDNIQNYDGSGDHQRNQQNKLQQVKQFQQALSLNERFLLNQRLEILSLIKQAKIQAAQKIIKQKIPKIYQIQPLFQTHMKAHILLRKIKQQSARSAIQYGRSQQTFTKNKQSPFPTYNIQTGMIQMIPLKTILTSVIQSKSSQRRFLKRQQFQYFAQYVNSLIMKGMGVMGNSRLGMILEHTSIALRKLQEFKGMSCGVRLVN